MKSIANKTNHLRKFSLGDFLKFLSIMNPEENGAVADRFAKQSSDQ